MEDIYEYSVITADNIYKLSDLVTFAINAKPKGECQPWGGIVIFQEATEGGLLPRYAQAMVYKS